MEAAGIVEAGSETAGPEQAAPSKKQVTALHTLVSLTVAPPTGQYDSSRLINFGTNRWAFKPEVGYSSIQGRCIAEAAAGLWLFTDNSDVLGANKEQSPIANLQAHISYDFAPGLWLSLDANYFQGGRSKIDGARLPDAQESSRLGLTLSLPLVSGQSIKLAYHVTAFQDGGGADFDALTVAYQLRWGSWRARR